MKVNTEFLSKLVGKAEGVSKDGDKLTYGDPNEIYQFVFATLAVGADLVPVVGPALGGFLNLLGVVVFPLKAKDTWASISQRVETLVDSKISSYHSKTLQARIDGFNVNMREFTKVLDEFQNSTSTTRERLAEIVREHHVAFLTVMRTSIPDFQIDEFSVQALPQFALAANIHVSLLAEGVRHGDSWGYPDVYIQNSLYAEFDTATRPSNAKKALLAREHHSRTRDILSRQDNINDMEVLAQAIKDGEASDWAADLIATWKKAYAALGVQERSIFARSNTDYRAYIDNTYKRGRDMVKPYRPVIDGRFAEDENPGITAAAELAAYADYDALMIPHALSYMELWPYLVGEEELPLEVGRKLDREIFSGPYGRYTTGVPWNSTIPPPVVGRAEDTKVSSVSVRAYDDVDMLQLKYGTQEGALYGDRTGGILYQFGLAANETIQTIHIQAGHKLGSLQFITTDNQYGPYGSARYNSNFQFTASHAGYAMSSAYVTNWSGHSPPGCEGVFLGFRPLGIISS